MAKLVIFLVLLVTPLDATQHVAPAKGNRQAVSVAVEPGGSAGASLVRLERPAVAAAARNLEAAVRGDPEPALREQDGDSDSDPDSDAATSENDSEADPQAAVAAAANTARAQSRVVAATTRNSAEGLVDHQWGTKFSIEIERKGKQREFVKITCKPATGLMKHSPPCKREENEKLGLEEKKVKEIYQKIVDISSVMRNGDHEVLITLENGEEFSLSTHDDHDTKNKIKALEDMVGEPSKAAANS